MNNLIVKLSTAFILLAMLFNFSSCGSSKKASRKKKKGNDSTVVIAPITPSNDFDKALADKYIPVWKKEIDFKTFSGKAKCHFEGKGQNHDFTANIRVKKNEAAWVNVSAMGGIVNVARMLVTPDSFTLINYLQNSYTSMKTSEANKVLPFPVDFIMLQNLLIGNALRTDGNVVNVVETNDAGVLAVKKDNLNQEVSVSKTVTAISALKLYLDNDNSIANIRYNDYQNISGRKFPKDRVVNVVNEGTPYLLEMNYNDVNFDSDVQMPFSIPKNYSKK